MSTCGPIKDGECTECGLPIKAGIHHFVVPDVDYKPIEERVIKYMSVNDSLAVKPEDVYYTGGGIYGGFVIPVEIYDFIHKRPLTQKEIVTEKFLDILRRK